MTWKAPPPGYEPTESDIPVPKAMPKTEVEAPIAKAKAKHATSPPKNPQSISVVR